MIRTSRALHGGFAFLVFIFCAFGLTHQTAAAAEPTVLSIGLTGFDGAVLQDATGGRSGKACIKLVNDKPSGWVEGGRNIDGLKHDFAELHFYAKSATAQMIAVRLTDATGQSFQHRLRLQNNDQWQQLKITNMASASQSWGGANDKKWHAPCQRIQFVLEGGSNDIAIDDIEAVLDAARITPKFEIQSATLGNVFLTGEKVTIPVETIGDSVSWQIRDFWGNIIGSGKEKVADGMARITPAFAQNGYFVVEITARKGDATLANQFTSFAVIEPADFALLADSPFGAMTHFAQGWDTDVMPLLVKAGISSIRDEQYWAHIEKEKGQFVFPAQFEHYMAEAKKQGLGMMYAATFGNPLHTGTWDGAPATDEARDAYANYIVRVLDHYPQLKTAEIWNEYNGSWCGGVASTDRSKYYAAMIKVAYQKIKATHPDVQVGGCATVSIPMPYIEGIFKHGGLPYMDAVVIHPYRSQPEGVESEIADLQALIRKYNNGKDKPIWVTETGAMPNPQEYDWETGRKMWEKSRDFTARYLVRQYALVYSTGTVEKIYWYLTRDYNEFKLMGLLRDPNDPAGRYAVAPPYVAMSTLIRQLYGTKPVDRAALSNKFAYVMRFDKGDQQVRVCWATQPAHIALKVPGPVMVVDMMGVKQVLTPVAGQVYLTLTDAPVYVNGKVEAVTETGHFHVAANQTTDILDDYGFDYSIDDPAITGSIEVMGQSSPVAGKSGRVIIAGQGTGEVRTDMLWYRLIVNGKPAGMGGIRLSVIDPIAFRESVTMPAANLLRLNITNASTRKDYALTSVNWKVEQTGGPVKLDAPLAKSKSSTIDLPMPAVQPYRPYDVSVTADFGAARTALRQSIQTSFNPCLKATVKADGELADWHDIPQIDFKRCGLAVNGGVGGQAQIAWDDENLYLSAKVPTGASLQFAMAPAFAGKWSDGTDLRGWYECSVGPDGKFVVWLAPENATVKATVAARGVGDEQVYELALPWAQLQGIKPVAGGAFRLSLLVSRDSRATAWGGGMVDEHTPDAFQVCRFATTVESRADAVVVTTQTLPSGTSMTSSDQPLADSKDDYSKDQGKNNWYYGFVADADNRGGDGRFPNGPYTDDAFGPMTQVQTMWGENWKGAAQYNTQTADMAHPGVSDGKPVWAVRRWKSNVMGTVRICGKFGHVGQGDGIGGKILVDGVLVYSSLVGGPDHPTEAVFNVTVPVQNGSLIDFAVTPGPDVDTNYDASTMRARIDLVK